MFFLENGEWKVDIRRSVTFWCMCLLLFMRIIILCVMKFERKKKKKKRKILHVFPSIMQSYMCFYWLDRHQLILTWLLKFYTLLLFTLKQAASALDSYIYVVFLCLLVSPDIIPSGWLGSKHQLTNCLLIRVLFPPFLSDYSHTATIFCSISCVVNSDKRYLVVHTEFNQAKYTSECRSSSEWTTKAAHDKSVIASVCSEDLQWRLPGNTDLSPRVVCLI